MDAQDAKSRAQTDGGAQSLVVLEGEHRDWTEAITAQTRLLAELDQLVASDKAESMHLNRADPDAVARAGF